MCIYVCVVCYICICLRSITTVFLLCFYFLNVNLCHVVLLNVLFKLPIPWKFWNGLMELCCCYCCSVTNLCSPWTAARQASLSITNSQSLLKLMSIELVMPSNHPLSSPSPPAFNLSQRQGLFQWVRTSHQMAKVLELQLSLSPSKEYSGDFGVDWLDLLAVQGTLKSLLQPHSSKASVLWHSGLFMVQLSHLYVTTGKTIHLTIQTFISKVTSLLFNMLSRLVIAFLPRSKYFFNFMAAVTVHKDFGAWENKSLSFLCFPNYLQWNDGPEVMIFVCWMLSFKPAFHSLLFHSHQVAL